MTLLEPSHDKTSKLACAPSEDSDEPGHSPSLIRVFAVRFMGSLGTTFTSGGQRRLRSDWADAQADLSLDWAHMPFCWFIHEVVHFIFRRDIMPTEKHYYVRGLVFKR